MKLPLHLLGKMFAKPLLVHTKFHNLLYIYVLDKLNPVQLRNQWTIITLFQRIYRDLFRLDLNTYYLYYIEYIDTYINIYKIWKLFFEKWYRQLTPRIMKFNNRSIDVLLNFAFPEFCISLVSLPAKTTTP